MTVPTRFARPEEMAEVQALVRAAYTPWIDIIGAEPGPMHDDYASKIAAKQVHVMADHDTGIFACKVLIPMTNVVLLDNIAIRPDMPGKGWGRRMMESSEFIARHYGFTRMRLYTHAKMTSNIAMYERNGYAITHRVTEHGLDRVYMEKRLPRERSNFPRSRRSPI